MPVTCATCYEFMIIKFSVWNNNVRKRFFCSLSCMGKDRSFWGGETHPSYKKDKLKKVCTTCNKEFITYPSRTKKIRGGNFYCSSACYGKNNTKEKHYLWKGDALIRECAYCGKQIRKKSDTPYVLSFCSTKCLGRWRSLKNFGPANPNYRDGYKSLLQTWDQYCKRVIHKRMSMNIRKAIRQNKAGRKWEGLVGYSLADLMLHLEKQFTADMSWDNIGKWHIDHKHPVSAFNFNSPEDEDFKKCWALDNLQPLWAVENMRKGAKILY